jgi:glycosyltransferase involved in cell wall biosynthesis
MLDSHSPRVLTDVEIRQSEQWQRATHPLRLPPPISLPDAVMRAFRAASLWRGYDVMITGDVRNAALYGLAKRMLTGPHPRLMTLEARFDDPLSSSLRWWTKRAFQQFAFTAVDTICISARREATDYAARLRLPPERFRFVPWHTNIVSPAQELSHDGYVFSAGRTGRDWQTLAKAAAQCDAHFVGVMSRQEAERTSFPSNFAVHMDIPHDRYLHLLRRARVVVIPLQVHAYSSGQVALLEAMALGKPVICTSVLGTEDYVVHGSNGLMVPPGDDASLASAIQSLFSDARLEQDIAAGALQTVLREHTFETYVSRILNIAAGLVATTPKMSSRSPE